MNKIYQTLALLLFAQCLFAQTKITFNLSDKSVAIDDSRSTTNSDLIKIIVKKGNYLEFEIKGKGSKPYEVTLTKNENAKTLTEKDFKNGIIKTDNSLAYNGLDLSKNFKITISSGTLIKKSIQVTSSVKQTTTVTPVTKADTKQAGNNTKQKQQRPVANAQGYKPGFPYYDAFTLVNYQSERPSRIDSILTTYTEFDKKSNDLETPEKMLSENPFFKLETRTANGLSDYITEAPELHGAGSIIGGIGASIGGLGVTTLSDGIAKFLIKRGKQELSLSFFQKFKKVIDNNKDLQVLFPATFPLLDAIDEDIYNYSAYLQNLREAFKKDITVLPKSLPNIIDNHENYFKTHKKLAAGLLGACYLAKEVQLEAHPGDILANIPDTLLNQFDEFSANSTNHYFKGSIQTLQLVSSCLRDTATADNASYWISAAQIRKLATNKLAFNIFMALLYQKAKNDYNGVVYRDSISVNMKGFTLKSFFDSIPTLRKDNEKILNDYKQFIVDFGSRAEQLNKMVKAGKNQPDSATVEKYAAYLKATVGLLEQASDVGNLPCPSKTSEPIYLALGKIDFHQQFKPYFDLSNYIADMAVDISRKNYSSAINNVVFIYNDIIAKPVATTASKVQSKKDSVVIAAGKTKTQFSEIVKYGSLAGAVATAKTSDEVEKAIEAAALPVGSYSIKQKSAFNVALNAYVGYGFDFRCGKTYANGIYAPIGFSISKGLNKAGAITFFASIIDVGSLVQYNLHADSTSTLKQDIRLESIISPSAQILYGIPKWPISVGCGWKRTPKLFFSNDTGFEVVKPHGVFNVSILIDIPIANLYNSSRK